MSEMVERAARAAYLNHWVAIWGGDKYDEGAMHWDSPSPTDENYRRRWIDSTRAAIEAMREPTEGMVKAGAETIDVKLPDSEAFEQIRYIWPDMIDEALK